MATLSEAEMIEATTDVVNGDTERFDSINPTLAELKSDVSKILGLLGSGG